MYNMKRVIVKKLLTFLILPVFYGKHTTLSMKKEVESNFRPPCKYL